MRNKKRTAKILTSLVLAGLLAGAGNVAWAETAAPVTHTSSETISDDVNIVQNYDGTGTPSLFGIYVNPSANGVEVSYTGNEINVNSTLKDYEKKSGRAQQIYGAGVSGENVWSSKQGSLYLGNDSTEKVNVAVDVSGQLANVFVSALYSNVEGDKIVVKGKEITLSGSLDSSYTTGNQGRGAYGISVSAGAIAEVGGEDTGNVTISAENKTDYNNAKTMGINASTGNSSVTVQGDTVKISAKAVNGWVYGIYSDGNSNNAGSETNSSVKVYGTDIEVSASSDGTQNVYATYLHDAGFGDGQVLLGDENTKSLKLTAQGQGYTYGVFADKASEAVLSADALSVSATTGESGSAYGIYSGNNETTVTASGKNMDITVTGSGGKDTTTVGVLGQDGGSVTLGDSDTETIDVSVNNTTEEGHPIGIWAYRKDKAVSGTGSGEVTVNGGKLNVSVTSDGTGYGILAQNCTTPSGSDGEDKTYATVNVKTADTVVTMTDAEGKTNGSGLVAMSEGRLYVNDGNLKVTADSAIVARGDAIVEVNKNKEEYTVQLDGNISFDYDKATSGTGINADVTVNLVGDDSYWNGNTRIYWDEKPEDTTKLTVSNMKLGLYDGATWNAEYIADKNEQKDGYIYAPLNNLTIDGGIVNAKAENQTLSIDNLDMDDGEINMNEKSGTLQINTKADISGGTITADTLDAKMDDVTISEDVALNLNNIIVTNFGSNKKSRIYANTKDAKITDGTTEITGDNLYTLLGLGSTDLDYDTSDKHATHVLYEKNNQDKHRVYLTAESDGYFSLTNSYTDSEGKTTKSKLLYSADGVLSGLADGEIAEGSTEAVTGGQLYSVQSQITELTKDGGTISEIKGSIGDLTVLDSSLKSTDEGGNDTTTVVSAVNKLNDKVGDLKYTTAEDGKGYAVENGQSATEAIGNLDTKLKEVAESAASAGVEAAKHNTVAAGTNLSVSTSTDEKTQGTKYTVSLNKDITLGEGENAVVLKGSDGAVSAKSVSAKTVTADTFAVGTETYIDGNGINANGKSISNVNAEELTENGTYAATTGQLYTTNANVAAINTKLGAGSFTNGAATYTDAINGNTASIWQNSLSIHELGREIDSVGAISAALAGMHPLDYDGSESKWQMSAALGSYDGASAVAMGGFYHVNEDVLLSGGVSTILKGERKTAMNMGVTFRVGQGGSPAVSLAEGRALAAENRKLAEKVEAQDAQNKELREQVARQDERIAEQDAKLAELRAQFEELLAKVK